MNDDFSSMGGAPEVELERGVTDPLFVGAPFKDPDDLNRFEQGYRRWGIPPVLFVEPMNDENPDGPEVLGNAPEFAKLMGLDPGEPVTVEEAIAFIARYTGPSGQWVYWQLMELMEAAARR